MTNSRDELPVSPKGEHIYIYTLESDFMWSEILRSEINEERKYEKKIENVSNFAPHKIASQFLKNLLLIFQTKIFIILD